MIYSLENINDYLLESRLKEGIFEDFVSKFGSGARNIRMAAIRRPQMQTIMQAKDPMKMTRANNPITARPLYNLPKMNEEEHVNNIRQVHRLKVDRRKNPQTAAFLDKMEKR
jgi:hypothetical protein